MMHKISLITVPLVIVFLAAIICLWVSPNGISQAPNIRLTITDGTSIDLKKLRGKPVLVTFWATSCVSCVREIPYLITLYSELSDDGLEIIGVAMPYDPPNHVVEMIAEREIPYPVAIDIEGNAVVAFGDVIVTPTSFLIAPDGTITKHTIGEMDMDEFRDSILSMLSNQNTVSSLNLISISLS